MTHDEEHGLPNESKSALGESGEGETHESNVKPITGQFELFGQTLQPCETWTTSAPLLSNNQECVLTDISYDEGGEMRAR